ncbi:cytochrome b-c1 complex subunit 6, mitochondrial-like [Crassostrea virginica]|uniref:Cytochrome b-c1 complex subunit 6, mitochondrial-like n=1 Tax=Crassostrea virginica TaxID=6565 RepID=A0A8B8CH83_CRAVI|nr:cytochrome b-c1 complex subunit 6, mitochondrial-like [Crassostrea virginica]
MALGDEVVYAGDPEEQENGDPEEEEEEELEDPQRTLRDECVEKNASCKEFKEVLDKCNERVAVNPAIEEETCEEELIDFVHCVDHCVAKKLFGKLA